MLKYNNTHIFTGYLKQLLSSFNLPTCKIYTHEFAKYYEQHGKEDPRILESFDGKHEEYSAVRINYLKDTEVCNYFWPRSRQQEDLGLSKSSWKKNTSIYYDSSRCTPGLTKTLYSPGINYDTKTHEYLGEYLRFLRDYHNVNLMSLYNCFSDKIYNNVYFNFTLDNTTKTKAVFNTQDPNYRIYAIPVKLFEKYTIAIDCDRGIELFCGLYNTALDTSSRAENLAKRTYQKLHKTAFSQPFLYDRLSIKHWPVEADFNHDQATKQMLDIRTDVYTRWDLVNYERDLRLFIKVPVSCRSSITILEGDFRTFNNYKYAPLTGTVYGSITKNQQTATIWTYDATSKTLKATINGKDYILGTEAVNGCSELSPIEKSANPTPVQFILSAAGIPNNDYKGVRPEVGKNYKLVLSLPNKANPRTKKHYYFAGEMASIGDFSCTDDYSKSVDVSIDANNRLTYSVNGETYYVSLILAGKIPELVYQNNRNLLNFNTANKNRANGDGVNLNNYTFQPISQLQLLAFNTGESYPFADRLIEYLSGSAITPLDEIPDNIKRVQQVMNQSGQYFDIEGLWENKMQNILYDYVMNSGDIEIDHTKGRLVDKRRGIHRRLGHTNKSTLYDILGYVDRDTEKWYASWKKVKGKSKDEAQVGTSLQNVDIYDGLYDLS